MYILDSNEEYIYLNTFYDFKKLEISTSWLWYLQKTWSYSVYHDNCSKSPICLTMLSVHLPNPAPNHLQVVRER
jgi:hypothetical protein